MHIFQNYKMLEFLSRCKTRGVAPLRGSTVSRNFTKIAFFLVNSILERASKRGASKNARFSKSCVFIFFY